MIHDAGDGTTGRRVWRIGTTPPVHVIAATEQAARTWHWVETGKDLGATEVTDMGPADRTELYLWRDETRLDGGTA